MDVQMDSLLGVPSAYGYMNGIATNPTVLIIIALVVVGYIVLFMSMSGRAAQPGSGAANGAGSNMLEIFLWGVFVLLLVLNGAAYFFNFDVTASLANLFSPVPEIDMKVNNETAMAGASPSQDAQVQPSKTVPELTSEKQVFHIPGNLYGYEDSKAVCKAYGGRLASYNEIEKAYEKGGDWCSYGWSEDQMALFPTQPEKYEELQKIPGHEHDCGRPGINGGYIANPNVRFGINCYGYKPKITKEEQKRMQDSPLYPPTQSEVNFEKKVELWRAKLSEIEVAPFDHDNWSMP